MAIYDPRPWYEREAPWMPTMEELDAAGCVACGRTNEAMREEQEIPVSFAALSKAGFQHSFCRECRRSFERCALGLVRSVFVRAKAEVASG